MMSVVVVDVHECRKSSKDSHSFLIGSDQGGLSERLDSLVVEEDTLTLKQLRPRIQETQQGGMIKRTLMCEEILYVLKTCPNPHGWPEDQREQYRFGIIKQVGTMDHGHGPSPSGISSYKPPLLPQYSAGHPCGNMATRQ